VWIDTGAPDGHAKEIESGHSYQNEVEANVVLELLEEISANNTFLSALIEDTKLNSLEAGIGIIANYRAQSQLIRQKLMTCPVDLALKDTCKVDTVDSYQGKENPVIIVSLTRCNSRGDSGFVRSAERINVALSRAKESLVIVGSLAFWRDFADSEPLRKVAKYIEGKVNSGDAEFKIISKDPWGGIDDRLKPGDIVSGIVIRLLAYGAFIEIEKNLVGFIHVSEVSWGKEKVRPNDTLEIGERISAKVLQISPEERKMSLSIRELQANPWEEIKRHMRVGGKMSGRVKNLVKFGAFIEIGNGVEGLLHNSDIPNTLPSSSAADVLSLGQEVELMILFIDDLNQRVSLGMKQLDAEAWELSSANNLLGAVVEGTVLRSFGNIVLVILDGGIEGVIEASEGMVLKNNERISVKVVGIDNILQRLNLEFKSK
jgi:predicted RNA-binding protein with RPS1 domain